MPREEAVERAVVDVRHLGPADAGVAPEPRAVAGFPRRGRAPGGHAEAPAAAQTAPHRGRPVQGPAAVRSGPGLGPVRGPVLGAVWAFAESGYTVGSRRSAGAHRRLLSSRTGLAR